MSAEPEDELPGASSSGESEEADSDAPSASHAEDEGGPLLGDLVARQQDGTVHARSLRQPAPARAGAAAGPAAGRRRDFKRDNKNRPMELSSKRPVPRFRDVLQVPKSEGRDPRFNTLSGAFVEERFRKQYAFVFDEALPDEKRALRGTLQRAKSAATRAEVQAQLTRVEQQIREEQARRQRAKIAAELKAREREAVRGGKRVFHKKRAARRADELRVRFEELKASGRLEKALAKRRRKNAAKDHRYVPSARRGA